MSEIFCYDTDSLTKEKLPHLSEAFSGYLRSLAVPAKVRMSAEIMLEEVSENIIGHAAPHRSFSFRCELKDDLLEIEFRDNGNEFNPLKDAPVPDTGLSAEERKIGGLGIMLVRKFSDSISYNREGDENVLYLIKKIEDG
ncbi:putative anti-sigma regulatory factor, serine/threonine protein kinase [Methanolacinia petrolearia DSM 11571]|uniref:Putative anti-sigma regulatory factor, serine/threonine protein kinase n=1 Tax=Methanolacinia petrolearia (strain DSM 11571 / OCM 486 / SEBR 4847) TaxID=679926 RepID=E1RJS2_METP4|nr:ATP-binding protein [Methanolacinia petrolearia]ADN35719.1 putative anti-sigma regulatory factor, serine/threonine protein kinase [Methanolacinia petrolearia DSM 11571]